VRPLAGILHSLLAVDQLGGPVASACDAGILSAVIVQSPPENRNDKQKHPEAAPLKPQAEGPPRPADPNTLLN
jgi:hypothetical protein